MDYKKLSKITDTRKTVEGITPEVVERLVNLLKKDYRYLDVTRAGTDVAVYNDDKLFFDYNSGAKRLRYDDKYETYVTRVPK